MYSWASFLWHTSEVPCHVLRDVLLVFSCYVLQDVLLSFPFSPVFSCHVSPVFSCYVLQDVLLAFPFLLFFSCYVLRDVLLAFPFLLFLLLRFPGCAFEILFSLVFSCYFMQDVCFWLFLLFFSRFLLSRSVTCF